MVSVQPRALRVSGSIKQSTHISFEFDHFLKHFLDLNAFPEAHIAGQLGGLGPSRQQRFARLTRPLIRYGDIDEVLY
jgi:hypothetical protein